MESTSSLLGKGGALESLRSLSRELEPMTPFCVRVGPGCGLLPWPHQLVLVPTFLWVWRPAGGSEQEGGSLLCRHCAHPPQICLWSQLARGCVELPGSRYPHPRAGLSPLVRSAGTWPSPRPRPLPPCRALRLLGQDALAFRPRSRPEVIAHARVPCSALRGLNS